MTHINLKGLILTLKNLGSFLATWFIIDIKADLQTFLFALLVYTLINVPSDLFLMNDGLETIVKNIQKKRVDNNG